MLPAVRLATALLAFCGIVGCVCAADPPRVDIEMFPERSLGPISPYVFGAGIDHKTNPMRFCRYPEQVAKGPSIPMSGLEPPPSWQHRKRLPSIP